MINPCASATITIDPISSIVAYVDQGVISRQLLFAIDLVDQSMCGSYTITSITTIDPPMTLATATNTISFEVTSANYLSNWVSNTAPGPVPIDVTV